MAGRVIERDKLGVLTKIAQGGQGVVYQAPNVKTKFASSMVYKEYKPHTVAEIDFTALTAMPALVEDSLSYAQAERLISMAAWPCAMVEHASTPTGFVMPAIPQQFFIALTTVKGSSTSAAEFQHLLNHPSVLAARGITLDDAQRYTLLRETASALVFLHKHGVCVGDISPKNLLFSLTPHEAVYFIDCDAMRIHGVSALPQVETPGWNAPPGEELATIYTDTYKLGLLALRLLSGDHDTTNPGHLPPTTPGLLRQIITDTLTNQPHQRPLPEAWSYVLGHAIEQAQHQAKTTPPASPALPAPPIPTVHSRPTPHSAPPVRPSAPPPRPANRPPVQIGAPKPPRGRRHPLAIAAGAVIVVAVTATAGYLLTGPDSKPATTSQPSTTITPVAEAALDGLLLSPDQINTAMDATGMTATDTHTTLFDASAKVADKACLPIYGVAQVPVYADSGWSAVRSQQLKEPPDSLRHMVEQAVVLFSSAHDAGAFFTASALNWPACANRQYTYTVAGQPDLVFTVGPVSNTNGTLSATETKSSAAGWPCQRALTVANNVAIDVEACSYTQPDSAVNIAQQIAAKVPT